MMLRRFIYVQVHRGHFTARVVNSTSQLSRQCADLSHPRSLFNKFEPIRSAFAAAFKDVDGYRFGFIKPTGLVHLIPKVEGGYTQAELRAFREAAEAAGIHHTLILDDKYGPLTDEQLSKEILPALSPF